MTNNENEITLPKPKPAAVWVPAIRGTEVMSLAEVGGGRAEAVPNGGPAEGLATMDQENTTRTAAEKNKNRGQPLPKNHSNHDWAFYGGRASAEKHAG